jgi:alcohol dehydrogenase class IV
MVTNTTRAIKGCVWHPRHRPLAAILDPELTVGLPPKLTAWTGCDALVHAIEAYCVPSWHPICDGVALEAMGLIHRWLGVAVDQPGNLEARGAMLAGSCLAGVAFLKGLGLVHALSHMIGATYDTHHGLTNAVLLPVVLRYNRGAISDKVPAMCRAMDLPGGGFDDLYGATVALLDRLDIPRGLADLGVEPDRAREIAKKALTDAAAATNPAPANLAQIEELLLEGIRQAR